MTSIVAERFQGIKPSPSMAAKARVEALRASGRTIVDFTLGEPDFATPAHIVSAGIEALRLGQTKYTSSMGTLDLRKSIAQKLKRENGLTYDLNQIVVGCGAKHVIFNAFSASLESGDEVIIPAPYWVSYPDMVSINGGLSVIVPCSEEQGFKLQPAQLEASITPRTKWLVLNTPNNPTGAVYSKDELLGLIEVLRRHPQVWLMTDEIYEHFIYGSAQHHAIVSLAPDLLSRSLVINGMSKAFAMTGWRIGYGAGPESLIKGINLLITQSTTCPSAMSQYAATQALNGSQECVREASKLFEQRRDVIVKLLNEIPGVKCPQPDGAFYVFPSVQGLIGKKNKDSEVMKNDIDIMNYLLETGGVAAIDGTSYGAPNHLRLSFATSTDLIIDGCTRIKNAALALS
jgi:aspartate aminotransferase